MKLQRGYIDLSQHPALKIGKWKPNTYNIKKSFIYKELGLSTEPDHERPSSLGNKKDTQMKITLHPKKFVHSDKVLLCSYHHLSKMTPS